MSEPLTTEELERIERAWSDATPGPWAVDAVGWDAGDSHVIVSGSGAVLDVGAMSGIGVAIATAADMEVMAQARSVVPMLIAEVRRLRAELAEAKEKAWKYDQLCK